MARCTEGASKSHVELYVLRCLKSGEWKQAGEIKDYVERNADLPPSAKQSLSGRPAEGQVRNSVQNVLRRTVASSLTGQKFIEHDDAKGYRVTSLGIAKLDELESWNESLNEIFADE